MGRWTGTEPDGDLDGDGPAPWALGDDDEPEPLGVDWGNGADDDAGDPWLDEQLSELHRTIGEGTPHPSTVDGAVDGDRPDRPVGVVLRRAAPARSSGRRRADPDAAADLPAPHTPGYVRDRRGTWRYAATGRAVPG